MNTPERFGRYLDADRGALHAVEREGHLLILDDAPWLGGRPTGEQLDPATVQTICPVQPSKILCIGRNYRAHAKEMNAQVPSIPLLFLKPPSALLAPGGTVLLPPESARVEHEGELGVVIGRPARRVTPSQAMDYVFGYTIVGDITARDLQRSDGQWSRGKGFDTFCPVGPHVVTGVDPSGLDLRVRVGDEVRQRGNTADMIFDVAALVSHLSQAMTLLPGDLIATGTPQGVGPVQDGDTLRIEVEGLGELTVNVQNEK